MMKGTNICPWLKRGSIDRCGRHCINEYCAIHRQQFRLGRKLLVPCRVCGVGTGSSTLLCRPCGSPRIAQKLVDTEKRARRHFARVLANLPRCPIRGMSECSIVV